MPMLDAETLTRARELFPYLAGGRIYVNHAATSPYSTRVVDALQRYIDGRTTGEIDTYWSDVKMVDELRESVRTMINAEGTDRIALLGNTTDALNVIASGLQWRAGDRVLLNDAEFPANLYPYINLKRLGVQLDFLHAAAGVVTVEDVARALTPRTRVLGLSAVQFLSGYRADCVAIGRLCRERGVIFVVDGIQSVGAVATDVQAMHVDALAAGAQKWQMATQGAGFLYLTAALQEQIHQAHLGWLSVHDPWEFRALDQPLAAAARRYEGGSLYMSCLHAMHASLGTLLEFGLDRIEQHLAALTGVLLDGLLDVPGTELITPRSAHHRAGIVTIRTSQPAASKTLTRELQHRHITAAAREGCVRFSPHFYNTVDEMHTIAAAVREIAAGFSGSAPEGKGIPA
jgi:cysteine desulfurase / selenocysteine lyase